MRGRIEAYPDYESKIYNDPIELLKAIRVLMYNTIRAQSPMAVMTEAILRLINIKQQEDPLLDYVKRFKQQRDILVSQIGKRFLDNFVEHLEEYRLESDQGKQNDLKKAAFNRWMAYLVMNGADQTKYGSILKQMVAQFSMGVDRYPKTLEVAVDVLTEHRFDAEFCELRKAKQHKDWVNEKWHMNRAYSIVADADANSIGSDEEL
jgi:hypothetical protein